MGRPSRGGDEAPTIKQRKATHGERTSVLEAPQPAACLSEPRAVPAPHMAPLLARAGTQLRGGPDARDPATGAHTWQRAIGLRSGTLRRPPRCHPCPTWAKATSRAQSALWRGGSMHSWLTIAEALGRRRSPGRRELRSAPPQLRTAARCARRNRRVPRRQHRTRREGGSSVRLHSHKWRVAIR